MCDNLSFFGGSECKNQKLTVQEILVMAVNARERRKTAYRNSVYVQGNTARRLQAVPDIQNTPVKKISNRTRKNRERALHMNWECALPRKVRS